jgi:RHS repeat-associated protein
LKQHQDLENLIDLDSRFFEDWNTYMKTRKRGFQIFGATRVWTALIAMMTIFLGVFASSAKPTSKRVVPSKKVARPITLQQGNQTRQVGLPSLAQYPSSPISGLDNINTFLGQVDIKIPLLTVGGRGSNTASLVAPIYQEWSALETYWDNIAQYTYDPTYNQRFNPLGVNVIPRSPGYGPGVMSMKRVWGASINSYWVDALTTMSFSTADGGTLQFYDKSSQGEPVTQLWSCSQAYCGFARGSEFVTTDGSGVTFLSDNPINDINDPTYLGPLGVLYPSGYMIFKDGTRYRIYQGKVLWERDRNGNRIEFGYDSSGRVTSITDPLKRSVTVEYDFQDVSPYGLCDRINYLDFNGNPKTIRVSHKTLSSVLFQGNTISTYGDLFPGYPFSGGYGSITFNPTVTSAVWITDVLVYEFYYNSYGEVARLELPTRGAFEYSYDHAPVDFNSGYYAFRRVTEKRIFSDQSTFVSRAKFNNFVSLNTNSASGYVDIDQCETTGCNPGAGLINRVRHYFYGDPEAAKNEVDFSADGRFYSGWASGREYRKESFSSNGQTLLQSSETIWGERVQLGWWRAQHPGAYDFYEPPNDRRVTSITTTLHDVSPGLIKLVAYAYDDSVPYNNLSDTFEYDFGYGTQGSLLRRTHTDYVTASTYTDSSVHLRSLPSQQWVSSDAAGSNKVSRVQYEYDNYVSDPIHAPLVDRPTISGLCLLTDSSGTCITPSSTTYTTRGNLTKVTRFASATESFSVASQYDVAGNEVKIFDGRSVSIGQQTGQYYFTDIDYSDRFGAPDGEARLNGAPSQLAGQSTYAFATSVTNPLGYINYTQFNYYTGKLVDSEDIGGTVTTSFYDDSIGRQTQLIVANNSPSIRSKTTIAYDDTYRIVTVTSNMREYGDIVLKTQTVYDGLGRPIESRSYEDASSYISSQQKYDALGRVYQTSNPIRPYLGGQLVWTTITYDALSRVEIVETPDGAKVRHDYNANVTTITDQAGKKRRSVADALGRLVRLDEPNASNILGAVDNPAQPTSYRYDAVGNLRMVTQGSQKRYFLYDSLSRLIRVRNPELDVNANLNLSSDSLTDNNSQWSLSYSYDSSGNLSAKTDARGTTSSYSYDVMNRITQRSYSGGTAVATPTVTYSYDSSSVANSKGRLTSVSNSVSAYNYTGYDALGRVTASQQVTDGQTYSMSYAYDLIGNMTSQAYPTGRVVTQSFDSAGRVTNMSGQSSGGTPKTYANSIGYTAHGAVERMRLGNGRWEHTNFNDRLQPTEIGLGASATDTSVMKLNYEYGITANNGNVLKQVIEIPTIGLATGFTATQHYEYDQLNRLTGAQEVNGTSSAWQSSGTLWQQKFSYDRFGNRAVDTANTTSTMIGPNPQISTTSNRITPRTSPAEYYEYDGVGNLKKGQGGDNLAYDAENKLVQYQGGATQSGGAGYFYDGDGNRVKKTTPSQTTTFVYNINGQLVAEYTTSTPENNGTCYLTSDTLGTPRVITKADGGVKYRHDYLPFGEELYAEVGNRTTGQGYDVGSNPTDKTRQKFSGKERDNETGLDYFLTRYYSSAHGRFSSYDPIFVTPKRIIDPQRLDLYVYARNNPLKFLDPDGMDITITADNEEEARGRFNTVLLGLRPEDRKHVTFFVGNGKNGYKKGQYYILVDKKHKSDSENFQGIQKAANDRTSLGRITVLKSGDTYTLRYFSGDVKKKELTTVSGAFNDGDFEGYTLFQYRGKDVEENLSSGRFTEALVNGELDEIELSATIYHELRAHMLLGDFGRNVPKARHSDAEARGKGPPTTEAGLVGERAEKEARENAKKKP